MPKNAKSQAQWQKDFQAFAQSSEKTMGRGRAPPKNSPEYQTYVRIMNCPARTCGGQQMTLETNCNCGFSHSIKPTVHKPKFLPVLPKKRQQVAVPGGGSIPPQATAGTTAGTLETGGTAAAASSPPKKSRPAPVCRPANSSPRRIVKEAPELARRPLRPLDVNEVLGVIQWVKQPSFCDLFVYGPIAGGGCIHCKSTRLYGRTSTDVCPVYTMGFPVYVCGVVVACNDCQETFRSFDCQFIKTLPLHVRLQCPFFFHGHAVGIHRSLIRMLRDGISARALERACRAEVHRVYSGLRSEYLWKSKHERDLGMIHDYEEFPPFPEEFCPKAPALLEALLADYALHKDDLLRELKTYVSNYGLAVKHKRSDTTRVKMDATAGDAGTQTFTVVGDLGFVLNYCVVPETNMDWADMALEEVVGRHAEGKCPKHLFVDCGCCNGKLKAAAKKLFSLVEAREGSLATERNSDGTKDIVDPKVLLETDTEDSSPSSTRTSDDNAESTTDSYRMSDNNVESTWKTKLTMVLDGFHLMMRIGREMYQHHPRYPKFMRELSHALYRDSAEDVERLERIWREKNLSLTDKQKRSDRQRFVRHAFHGPVEACARLLMLVLSHQQIDREARHQAELNGVDVNDLLRTDPAFPLITKKVAQAAIRQCVHILNGCTHSEGDSYMCIGTVNYRNTGVRIPEYRQLCGTSKVSALHSVTSGLFFSSRNIRTELFDARAIWLIINYNRRLLVFHGLRDNVPFENVAPSETEGAVLAPECNDLYFGFAYSRKVLRDTEESCLEKVRKQLSLEDEADVLLTEDDVRWAEETLHPTMGITVVDNVQFPFDFEEDAPIVAGQR